MGYHGRAMDIMDARERYGMFAVMMAMDGGLPPHFDISSNFANIYQTFQTKLLLQVPRHMRTYYLSNEVFMGRGT